MECYKDYRKKNVQPMRHYVPGEDMSGVSVSAEDTPEEGGMIACNPANPPTSGMLRRTSSRRITYRFDVTEAGMTTRELMPANA